MSIATVLKAEITPNKTIFSALATGAWLCRNSIATASRILQVAVLHTLGAIHFPRGQRGREGGGSIKCPRMSTGWWGEGLGFPRGPFILVFHCAEFPIANLAILSFLSLLNQSDKTVVTFATFWGCYFVSDERIVAQVKRYYKGTQILL